MTQSSPNAEKKHSSVTNEFCAFVMDYIFARVNALQLQLQLCIHFEFVVPAYYQNKIYTLTV